VLRVVERFDGAADLDALRAWTPGDPPPRGVPERVLEDSPARPYWLPTLHSVPGGLGMSKLMPSREIVPGVLIFTLSDMAWTPRGTVNARHLLHANLADTGRSFDDLVDAAYKNVRANMRVMMGSHTDGASAGLLMSFESWQEHGAAAAIALPSIVGLAAKDLGTTDIVFALACSDHLWAAPAGSPWADDMRQIVASDRCGKDGKSLVTPALFGTGPGGLVLLEQFGG
jgi:hypothetical protein